VPEAKNGGGKNLEAPLTGFPRLLESPGLFSRKFQDLESPENHFGLGKSWKLKLKVLESPEKYL